MDTFGAGTSRPSYRLSFKRKWFSPRIAMGTMPKPPSYARAMMTRMSTSAVGLRSCGDGHHGGVKTFVSLDHFFLDGDAGRRSRVRELNSDLHVPECLQLTLDCPVSYCGGAHCMADLSLVNGPTGIVVSFDSASGFPVFRFTFSAGGTVDILCEPTLFDIPSISRGVLASRRQLPLYMSWAISIISCQSISLNEVTLDLGQAIYNGMVHVAVSRVCSRSVLPVMSFDPQRGTVDQLGP